MDPLNIMKFLNQLVLISLFALFSSAISAESLPIGLSLNMSTAGAQYSLDFKNGVEAYFQYENESGRFGKFQLELFPLDDMGKKERVVKNAKRLIKNKNVLALLSTHKGELQKAVSDVSIRNKTLLLTSTASHIKTTPVTEKYIAYLTTDYLANLIALERVSTEVEQVFVLGDSWRKTDDVGRRISSGRLKKIKKPPLVSPLFVDDLSGIDREKPTLFVVNQQFISSAINIKKLSNSQFKDARFLVLPDSGASLIASSIKDELTAQQLRNIYYLNSVPLHLIQLPIIQEFKQSLHRFNPQASKNHQALKGYLLAKVLSEAIYHSVKGLKADSVMGLITLPFQVLDKVVGWVKNYGTDINRGTVVDSLTRVNHYDAGFHRTITLAEHRTVLGEFWLTQADKQGNFSEAKLDSRLQVGENN